MKKQLLGTAIVLAFGLAAGSAFAATTSTAAWNGNGSFSFNATTGGNGSTASMATMGNGVVGTSTFVNQENNPYGYGVTNTNFNVLGAVGAGGQISSSLTRDASYVPMYGGSGQSINAFVGTSDGTAGLVMNASTNYAAMQDVGYGQPRTAGGHTIDASGTTYQINYSVDTGVANNAGGVSVSGTGSASITQQFSGASGTGFNLANGGGIFTGANIAASGTGTFSFGGVATNTLTVLGSGNSLPGTVANPASFTGTGTFSGANATWTNYAISGHN